MHAGGQASAAVDGVWQAGPGSPAAMPAALDGQVRSILRDAGSRCYIGGGFDSPFDAVAYWDGNTYRSAGIPFWTGEASTNAMVEYQGKIHAAGRFPMPSGTAVLMRLEEENGQPMWIPLAFSESDEGAEGLSLTVHDDLLWFGGDFVLLDGTRNIAVWDGFAPGNVGDADGPVRALASHEGLLYAGGDFTNLGAACPPSFPGCPFDEENLAVWDGDWSEAFGGTDAAVYALHSVAGGDPMAGLYVGGDFNRLGSSAGHGGVARIHDENGPGTIDRMDGGLWSGKVRAIQRWGQGVAVGGTFTLMSDSDPTIAFNIATWTTANDWETMDAGLKDPVTDMPYGAAVLALERFMTPDSEGLHAGGNFTTCGISWDPCRYAARFFNPTTYKSLDPFVDAFEHGDWEELDEHSYLLSQTLSGQPASMTWGVPGARIQRMAWDPESLEAEDRLVLRSADPRLPELTVYRPSGPGPFLPPPVLELSPSQSGAVDGIRLGCVTETGQVIESTRFVLDELIRVDVSSMIDGIDSGLLNLGQGRHYNLGIRVGNPADTVVATDHLGNEVFRAENVVQFAIALDDSNGEPPQDHGRTRVELTGDLVFKLDRCGFGIDDEIHRLDPAAGPEAFEIVQADPLREGGVIYRFDDAGETFEIEGTSIRDAGDATGPLYSRRSMKVNGAQNGDAFGVVIEDRKAGLPDPRNYLQMDYAEQHVTALYRFDHPNTRCKTRYLGVDGQHEREIPDDLTFEVSVDASNGIEITEDDESGTTIIKWTNPGLIVFAEEHGIPAIEGATGMVIGKVEGADGDDTWDVVQRSYMRVVSRSRSDIFVGGTDFTITEGEETGPVGDLNGDGIVNGADLALILASWGACPDCPADLNGDGMVDGGDLAFILANWNSNFSRRAGNARRR